nr:DUF4010 domain-containing protein [Govania unica]
MTPPLATVETFLALGVALGLGLLVGLERGWSLRAEPVGGRYAGVRSFALIGLLGGFTAVLEAMGLRLYGLMSFAIFGLILVVTAVRPSITGARGITTFIAAIITFVVGICAGFQEFEIAAAVAVAMTVVLGMKDSLHRFIAGVERSEINAALQFLIISAIVLPMLPNQGYGPWQALNPYQLWWMVVLISAISLLGHFAVKWMAPGKGILLTGVLGGLVSSTAIAVSFSRMGTGRRELAPMLAAGILAASTIMFPRVLIVTFALSPALAETLLLPFALAMIVGLFAAWRIWSPRRDEGAHEGEIEAPESSFDIATPIQFGVLLALVMLAAAAARAWVGDQGLYYVAAVAGIVDVDAITVTASRGSTAGLSLIVASVSILIGVTSNSLAKAGFVAVLGGGPMLRFIWPGFLGMIVALFAGLGIEQIVKVALDAGAGS